MKKTVLGALLVVALLGLVATFFIPVSGVRTLASFSVPGMHYDSRDRKPIYEHTESRSADLKDFEASMEFTPYTTRGFTDLFQTADLERGLRVELHDRIIGLIVPAANRQGFEPYLLTSTYDPRTSHFLNIRVEKNGHISASLDHQQVLSTESTDLDYAISKIKVGSGFSPSRAFNGKIKDLSYSYNLYGSTSNSRPILWARLGLVLVGLVLLFLLSDAARTTVSSGHSENVSPEKPIAP